MTHLRVNRYFHTLMSSYSQSWTVTVHKSALSKYCVVRGSDPPAIVPCRNLAVEQTSIPATSTSTSNPHLNPQRQTMQSRRITTLRHTQTLIRIPMFRHIPRQIPITPTHTLLFSTPPSFHTNDSLDSTRKANLGSMIEYLREIIPEALRVVPDLERLDKEVVLRVAPSVAANVPLIKGSGKYITALKATQLIFTSFVLSHDTKLHITDLKVDEKGEGTGYGLYSGAAKVIVKWRTCGDHCEHLVSGVPKNGAEGIKHEWGRILHSLNIRESDEGDVERVMSGIFVFELTKDNDRILVHNVENIEMVDKKDFVNNVSGNLATG